MVLEKLLSAFGSVNTLRAEGIAQEILVNHYFAYGLGVRSSGSGARDNMGCNQPKSASIY